MKAVKFLSVFVFFAAMTSCDKSSCCDTCAQSSNKMIWVYYNETQCADNWGNAFENENEKKQNIITYFENLNVRIYDIRIVNYGFGEICAACFCLTGNRIYCKIKKNDLDVMKSENFHIRSFR